MSVTFNSTTPAAAAGSLNITWQKDGSGNVSGEYAAPFDMAVFAPGIGSNNQVLARIPFVRAVKFPASATLSKGTASAAATGSTTYTFKKNGVSFATADFAASATTATFTQASDATFAAGDVLEIDGPATADATLADVGLNLAGYKT